MMCGIYFASTVDDQSSVGEEITKLLERRGPDSFKKHTVQLRAEALDRSKVSDTEVSNESHITLISTVLALRGDDVEIQPLIDEETQAVLCWNGEAWKVNGEAFPGNDAHYVFQLLLKASKPSPSFQCPPFLSSCSEEQEYRSRICHVISSISGPFSFVYFNRHRSQLFYGRDCLGRRSLLSRTDGNGNLIISSIGDGLLSCKWDEVEADGLHIVDFLSHDKLHPTIVPWKAHDRDPKVGLLLNSQIPVMNKGLPPEGDIPILSLDSASVTALERELRHSLHLRLDSIPNPPTVGPHPSTFLSTKVAILFSGGLDCTVLARLAHDILPLHEPIDLLNVAFENPRVAAAANATNIPKNSRNSSPESEHSIYSHCPDRMTGRSSYAELQRLCPGRTFRFVAINIPYDLTLTHRAQIIALMHPHNTEMDLSIAMALYFAARGQGLVLDPGTQSEVQYTTPARVLLSGLGADELFGGYTRHATAFLRRGFNGLIDELELDVDRLGKRNLGRDDRVISHWGKEIRYPYLDESFMSWAMQCPVWEKCGFGENSDEIESQSSIEPGKKVLRLLAWKLGMHGVAKERKRAIQFGSRTAKMVSGKNKGTDILSCE